VNHVSTCRTPFEARKYVATRLFLRKPKMTPADFVRGFYNGHLFRPVAVGGAFGLAYPQALRPDIGAADPSFGAVDVAKFVEELRALY
jgi:hypothetical protein